MTTGDPAALADLTDRLAAAAEAALPKWPLPDGASVRLINVSENITYLVETDRPIAVLRCHRPGYNDRRAIECELAWAEALGRDGGVATPAAIPGRNGNPIQTLTAPGLTDRFAVLFHYIPGAAPDETRTLTPEFERLGEIAARAHLHAMAWKRPEPFRRLTWNVDTILGPAAHWGDWREAPNLSPADAASLEAAEAEIRRRLGAYGAGADRYGLIHADMRLANLIIQDGEPRLIDFDDCGFGWFMYDFAAAISFIEDRADIPELKAAWLKGYRRVRPLPDRDAVEIDTMIMLRRLALLAWIGSHIEAPEPQALAPDFTRVSAGLARRWLAPVRGDLTAVALGGDNLGT